MMNFLTMTETIMIMMKTICLFISGKGKGKEAAKAVIAVLKNVPKK